MMTITILGAIALLIPAVLAVYFAATNFVYDEKKKTLRDGESKPKIVSSVIAGVLVAIALLATLWKMEYIKLIEPGIRFDTIGWKWFLTIYFAGFYGGAIYLISVAVHKWLAFMLNWHIKHGHKK